MKALVLSNVKEAAALQEVPKPQPAAGQVLVRLHAAALNHRDVFIQQGLYPGIQTPVILGSDGAGVVVELGPNVETHWLDQAVVLLPFFNWDSGPVQPKDYHILGMPTNGCFAEYIAIDVHQLFPKPTHLSFEQAAALPLAGLTAYRALFTRGACTTQDRVLISGIGGGVALWACQLALAIGAEVHVTSGSEHKIEQAVALGAKGGINYKSDRWHKALLQQAGGHFDVVIDSAGGDGFRYFLDLAAPAGRIVFYGGTHGTFSVNPQKVFWKQLSLLGSTMGNRLEFEHLLALVNQYQIQPVVDSVWDLADGEAALRHMDKGAQLGKIVLRPTSA
mgnify:CR=1 FL=1